MESTPIEYYDLEVKYSEIFYGNWEYSELQPLNYISQASPAQHFEHDKW